MCWLFSGQRSQKYMVWTWRGARTDSFNGNASAHRHQTGPECTIAAMCSASLLSEISVRSPRKLFVFIIYKSILWVKVSHKKNENRSTGSDLMTIFRTEVPTVYGLDLSRSWHSTVVEAWFVQWQRLSSSASNKTGVHDCGKVLIISRAPVPTVYGLDLARSSYSAVAATWFVQWHRLG